MTAEPKLQLSTEDNFTEDDNKHIDIKELTKKIGRPIVKLHNDKNYKPYYWIDDIGTIYKVTIDKDKNLKIRKMQSFINGDGYVEYVLTTMTGSKVHTQGHRAVALAWHEMPESDVYLEANHKDGNRQNNNKDNIEFITHSDNIKHSYDTLGRVKANQYTVNK